MKISKLFHWLYGLVMLLPIFAIGVTCGYAMFNKNAYQSYAGEHINEENITMLDSLDDFKLNKTYLFDSTSFNNHGENNKGALGRTIVYSNIKVLSNNTSITNFDNYTEFALWINSSGQLYLRFFEDMDTYESVTFYSNQVLIFQFEYISNNLEVNMTYYEVLYSIEYVNESFLSEVFYYSIDRVAQSNMFSWAYNSFLVTPFAYIVNLFSMPVNSPVVMLLSYWLSISIIWLVFDLVMYVPLLVHRWLDKGAIE